MRKIYYNEAIIEKEEIDAVCDFIKTKGKRLAYGEEVLITEKKLADYFNVKYCLLVNSGSSANLLAFMALTSPELGNKNIKRGEEIITTALGFPTTVSPIINYGAVPVFVDVYKDTMNIDVEEMKKALSKKTRAVMIAHTLGNPAHIDEIIDFCMKNGLYLIEDGCDALGSKYNGRYTGTFGDISTCSYFPAHMISCGEGGSVFTDNLQLYKIMRSLRDWGRDYKCLQCKWDCDKRFDSGYDCRYTYSHFGFNLKVTEMQALILNKQIDRLPWIMEKRKENWQKLWKKLESFGFETQWPTLGAEPCWFSFVIMTDKYDRNDLVQYLERNDIGTRVIFAGNFLRHKCFETYKPEYRVIGDLQNTNYIMDNAFFIGCHPGMDDYDIEYITDTLDKYIQGVR